MVIEVEVRALITKEQYEYFLTFFRKTGKNEIVDHQEIRYLDPKGDLRILQTDHNAKIILKHGDLHATSREETEIHCGRDEFPRLVKLFDTLGYKTAMIWYRSRHTFQWEGITVMVDAARGLEPVIELEMLTTPEESSKSAALLRAKLKELNIEETPVEKMRKRFEYYAQHWRELI